MSLHSHTLREFDRALVHLKDKVLKMSSCCRLSLNLCAQALLGRDDESANRAIAEDEGIDDLELAVDRDGLAILAGFSPVASDLRLVLTLMRLSGMLERIGDCCVSIARRAKKLNKTPEVRASRFAEPAFHMLGEYLDAMSTALNRRKFDLVRQELEQASEREEFVQALTRRFTEMAGQPEIGIAQLAELIFISRSLEAIAFNLHKIGNEILYIETSVREYLKR